MGTPEAEVAGVAGMLAELGAVLVFPGYRLAPEHPFPAALDDSFAALTWVLDHAGELGVDPERVAVAGGSAGGGLAAALVQRCRAGGIGVRAQVLAAPMLDDRTVLMKEHYEHDWFMIGPESIRLGWTSYLGAPPSAARVPPLYAVPARTEDLADLPPAWIGVGDRDLFHGESLDYGERLAAAGVPCDVHVGQGMYHAASFFAPDAGVSIRYNASLVDFLCRNLA